MRLTCPAQRIFRLEMTGLVQAREAEGGVHRRESGALDEGGRVIGVGESS
jgi:hypothetical protein